MYIELDRTLFKLGNFYYRTVMDHNRNVGIIVRVITGAAATPQFFLRKQEDKDYSAGMWTSSRVWAPGKYVTRKGKVFFEQPSSVV